MNFLVNPIQCGQHPHREMGLEGLWSLGVAKSWLDMTGGWNTTTSSEAGTLTIHVLQIEKHQSLGEVR